MSDTDNEYAKTFPIANAVSQAYEQAALDVDLLRADRWDPAATMRADAFNAGAATAIHINSVGRLEGEIRILRAELNLPARSELEGASDPIPLTDHVPSSGDEPTPLHPSEPEMVIYKRFAQQIQEGVQQIQEVADEGPLDAGELLRRLIEAVGGAIGSLEREMRVLRMELGRAPHSAWTAEPEEDEGES